MKRLVLVLGLLALTWFVKPYGTAYAGAGELFVSQVCASGRITVGLSWTGNDPSARQQWIDLSTQDNGWLPMTFVSAGPLGGSLSQYQWTGLTANTVHFVRINQQLVNGSWDASYTFQVVTGACASSPAPSREGLPAYAASLTDAQLNSHDYIPEFKSTFLTSCIASSGGMRSACMCMLDALARMYTLREAILLEKDLYSTDAVAYRAVVAKLQAIVEACR